MYNNLRRFYGIKNLAKEIKRVCRNCKICGKYKQAGYKKLNYSNIMAKKAFKKISTDIYGPFKLNNFITSGKKEVGYILSITDILSRITKLYFLYKVDTEAVIKSFEEWIKLYGKPDVVISDNGRQFISNETKDYLKAKFIHHNLVPTYTPSFNGISESINKTISFI